MTRNNASLKDSTGDVDAGEIPSMADSNNVSAMEQDPLIRSHNAVKEESGDKVSKDDDEPDMNKVIPAPALLPAVLPRCI